ncbi:Crp/Fnr family transcriptional regulator [Martelella sp. HB161492]|uniref:Crp/Fnr family transcriptional regulator n=1 Tax=Martelella sp. HB161492 TaxID=2720726 RepID=UPI0015922080|nr:Crp/Fnr family transcriptional regulator [Martelella sp. HB161492]
MRTTTQHPSLAAFIDGEEGAELRRLFTEQHFTAGMLLPDDREDRILIVRQGRLRLYLANEDRELSLGYLLPGDVFSTHTRAQLSAQEDSAVLIAPRQVVERQFAHYPLLQEAILRVLAATLAKTMTIIEDLAFHPVRGRFARYLIRLGSTQTSQLAAGTTVKLDLSMEQIATLIGTTRQTASTELNAMLRDGAIARQGRNALVILQPERLRRWAGEAEI